MTVLQRPAEAKVSAPLRKRVPPWRNPWRRPYVLATITWVYILWSLLPVLRLNSICTSALATSA